MSSVRRGFEAYGHYQAQRNRTWTVLGEEEFVAESTVGSGDWDPENDQVSREAPNTKNSDNAAKVQSLRKAREIGTLKAS